MKTKAVLFDLGGTLIKTLPIPEIIKRILEAHGIQRSIEEIARVRKTVENNSDIEQLPSLGDEFWIKWNTQVIERLRISGNIPLVARNLTKLWWQYADVKLYSDAEETLNTLKQKELKIGLITNGLATDVKEILPKVGLTGFFDIEVTSDTIGKMKPHKEVFLHALEEMDVSPYEAIFVGDMVEYDYVGALECGLRTFLIDRNNDIKTEKVETLGSLTELLQHL